MRLHAKVKGHAAQYQANQHHGHRQIQRAQNHAMRHGEYREQNTDAQHQPGFIGIPERAYAGDHGVLVVFAGTAHQHAHAQVVAVQNHIGQHGQAHHDQKDDGHPAGGLRQVRGKVKHWRLLLFRGN